MVDIVFSDKTGTITENEMIFDSYLGTKNYYTKDEKVQDENDLGIMCLSLNHSILVTKSGKVDFSS